ncbi:response regulator transcription factor [Streptomyces sp. SP18ES09]|uniref:response regulator transcription factor n=1 Tax=unclassified Streptomyces TaxID=2593676 RepID=UPI002E7A5D29|nr:response regulator transcription factor [Streptomyces sp. SP18ES09]MEE1820310.1 response regulator transcription factor [Streptomyces sp. SP18ES09]
MTTRVLVVDDQYLIRAGIVGLLEATDGMTVVGEAGDGEEAVVQAARLRPDVILMDIRMPRTNGIDAARRILADAAEGAGPPPRILMLTTFDLDEYVYRALRAGASGFILKDTGPKRLLAAVAAVAGGDALFAPSVTRRLVEAFTRTPAPGGPVARRPEIEQLTARETEVLRLAGTGRSNAEIAEELFISEATVKTHLNRTMAKLDLSSRAQIVVLAYETGLVAPGGGPTSP